MPVKTKRLVWTVGFLGVTFAAIVMELVAGLWHPAGTIPWTEYIARYVPWPVQLLAYVILAVWLPLHFWRHDHARGANGYRVVMVKQSTGPVYAYAAVVTAVHDGDTVTADIDLGFDVHTIQHVRLAGCNARELAQPGGPEAAANLTGLLLGKQVVLHTVRPDKFGGRYDAAVTLADGTDLVAELVAQQWAAPWDGTGPKPVPPWPRTVGTQVADLDKLRP